MLGPATDGFIATGGLVPGCVVVQVRPVLVKGAALLAREAAGRLDALDTAVLTAACAAFDHPGISIVEPALLAARLGAIALHDPTEGAWLQGYTNSHASDVEIRIDRKAVCWFEPGVEVCRTPGADPWVARRFTI